MSDDVLTFERRDAVPLGRFSKHTWRLTSLSQVRSVFENPFIKLESTRTFVPSADGTSYRVVVLDQHESTSTSVGQEVKTTLKDSNFTIEWIPDILPITQIGELRLRFEFDHLPPRSTPSSFILGPVNTASPVKKTTQPTLAPRPPQQQKIFANNENILSFPITTDTLGSGESITLLTF